jgi:hypothetical protein
VSCCGRGAKAPEQIEERKLYLGSRGFAGQYDQEPVPLGGAVFLTEWLQHSYRGLPRMRFVCLSFDRAWKTKSANDYSACPVWGVSEENRI